MNWLSLYKFQWIPRGILVVVWTLSPGLVFAQDSLTQKATAESDPVNSGLQSGRYQSKSGPTTLIETVITPASKKRRAKKAPASVGDSNRLELNTAEIIPEELPDAQEKNMTPAPGLGDQWSDLWHGGSGNTGALYRARLHPDDNRLNHLELEAASGVINDSSAGNETYRTYSSTSPYAQFGGHFWVTPLVGLSASYQSTLGESINNATNGSTGVAVKSEWMKLSFDFRNFYGLSRKSTSLQWGFILSEYKFTVPASESSRVGLRTDSVGTYLKARFPSTPHYSWLLQGELYPYENSSEIQTSLALSSGTFGSAYRVGLAGGGEFKFSRESQIIWTLGVDMDSTTYSGTSSLADPASGRTPSGVSILNTWTYLHLGYLWGQ